MLDLSVRYPYAAAFVAYSKGAPLSEVSEVFGIPLETLQKRAQWEGWPALVRQSTALQTGVPPSAEKTEARLRLIEENRAENYRMACLLRADLLSQLEKLVDGELQIEKSWNNKGCVVTHLTDPSTGDRVNLATYARTIADLTYRALGDREAAEGGAADVPGGTPAPPSITVILPGVIQAPREQRHITEPTGPIIDLREVSKTDVKS